MFRVLMRHLSRLIIFIFALLAINTTAQQTASSAEQEVLNASAARRDAYNRRDFAALDRYIADDCLISTDDGALVTKADLLIHLKNLPSPYDQIANARDFAVRVHDGTAVISLRSTAHERFTDTDIVTEQRRTESWMKRDGGWVLVAVQTGNLPANFRKSAVTGSHNLKDYVGQYEWRRRGEVDVVTLRDGKLWSRFDNDEDEYLPLGSDTFFTRNDLGTVTFTRDPGGRVTGYTYHRVDGQQIDVKRIR